MLSPNLQDIRYFYLSKTIAGTHAVSNAVPLTIIDNQEKFKPSQESPRHIT
jgi:hypothetical protein